jgi:hypothetical protein
MVILKTVSRQIQRVRDLALTLLGVEARSTQTHDAPPLQAQFPDARNLPRCDQCGNARLEFVGYLPKKQLERAQWTFRCSVCGRIKQVNYEGVFSGKEK